MVDTDIHARAAYDRPYEMLTSALAESLSYERTNGIMIMAPPRHALVVESKKDEKLSSTPISKKLLQYLSHRMFAAHAWSIKYRRKEKLIAQFREKLRDERFEPN